MAPWNETEVPQASDMMTLFTDTLGCLQTHLNGKARACITRKKLPICELAPVSQSYRKVFGPEKNVFSPFSIYRFQFLLQTSPRYLLIVGNLASLNFVVQHCVLKIAFRDQ